MISNFLSVYNFYCWLFSNLTFSFVQLYCSMGFRSFQLSPASKMKESISFQSNLLPAVRYFLLSCQHWSDGPFTRSKGNKRLWAFPSSFHKDTSCPNGVVMKCSTMNSSFFTLPEKLHKFSCTQRKNWRAWKTASLQILCLTIYSYDQVSEESTLKLVLESPNIVKRYCAAFSFFLLKEINIKHMIEKMEEWL